MNLRDALAQYLAEAGAKLPAYAHQELHRFGRSLGLERELELLRAPDVAAYAENIVASGGDIHGRLAPVKEFLNYSKKKNLSDQSLAPHVKIPRAAVPKGNTAIEGFQYVAMTAEGIASLKSEMNGLKGHRQDMADAIKIAAADKDFRENAPLDAAKEAQGLNEGRISEIEEMLRRAFVPEKGAPGSGAWVGQTVVLKDLSNGKQVTYKLVNSAEADPSGGKVSVDSPVGRAVAGTRAGASISVQAPSGERKYEIISVES